jgi:hypothetical protein
MCVFPKPPDFFSATNYSGDAARFQQALNPAGILVYEKQQRW